MKLFGLVLAQAGLALAKDSFQNVSDFDKNSMLLTVAGDK